MEQKDPHQKTMNVILMSDDLSKEDIQKLIAKAREDGYIEGTKDGLERSKACEESVYKTAQRQAREEIMLGLKKLGYGAALVELESYLEGRV